MALPPPNYFELGEQYFDAGNYGAAAEAYNSYLQTNPLGPNQDRALFRLALAHAAPESSVHDLSRATELLEQLVVRFPQSPLKPPAEFLLRQQAELAREEAEVARLREDVSRREARIQELSQELEKIKQEDLPKLRTDVRNREERIRQLTEELQKLKQIDMERRPAAPPP